MDIKFGTDGWRGVIAQDFTFDNLARVAQATARYYKRHKKIKNGIVIGYDARFLSKEFAEKVAEVIGNAGINVVLSDKISSTPMVSLLTLRRKAAGGVVITASHNPAKYNGFKIKGDFGGPAHPEMIEKVEKELAKIRTAPPTKKTFAELVAKGTIKRIDFTQAYVEDLRTKIDTERIKAGGIRIAYDAMHGAGQGVMDQLVPLAVSLRGTFNPSFGGAHPEPLPQHLRELAKAVVEQKCDIAIATDGDADRVGAFDEKGTFVDSHRIFAVLVKYLWQQKGWRGEVAKSFSVSQIIDKMCKAYGITLHETAIGFKHLCRLMTERDILVAAEESGGLGVKGHLPERDGIHIGLLLCEIMAVRKKKLSDLVAEVMTEFGWHHFDRYDAHLTEKEKKRILGVYKKGVKTLAGHPVQRVETKDGFKLFVQPGWVLVRASGTEPLIRFYAEADTPERVQALLSAARAV
ncbi:MAG: phosphoglucomutase/phosphomannomutase family protein [Bacteroidetes bacterium]|jgi:phosphomannomutase|nr:phosphoglucomutase/phosphomannomutase family protein [Bacteroidota bacterium]